MIYKIYIGGIKVMETSSRDQAVKRFLRAAKSSKSKIQLTHQRK